MKSEKTKDMSIYIYLMYIMENCKEINEIVKDDLNAAKKYICSNLDLDIKMLLMMQNNNVFCCC